MTYERETEDFVGLLEEAKDHLACTLGRLEVAREQEVIPRVDLAKLARAEVELRGVNETLKHLQTRAYERLPKATT